ncbi:hypothetical protein T06_5751 [Trichinella sp. T6]|nr:hypothetical protein T06_5751 [Trichinella sp. T6]
MQQVLIDSFTIGPDGMYSSGVCFEYGMLANEGMGGGGGGGGASSIRTALSLLLLLLVSCPLFYAYDHVLRSFNLFVNKPSRQPQQLIYDFLLMLLKGDSLASSSSTLHAPDKFFKLFILKMMLIKCSIGKSVNQFAILISILSDAYTEIQILLYTFIVVVLGKLELLDWKDLNLSQFFHIITAVDVNRQCHFPFSEHMDNFSVVDC